MLPLPSLSLGDQVQAREATMTLATAVYPSIKWCPRKPNPSLRIMRGWIKDVTEEWVWGEEEKSLVAVKGIEKTASGARRRQHWQGG